MSLVAFFLGLALGIGFWFCWQAWLNRQLGQILRSLPTGGTVLALPILSRLRRGINLANQERQDLEFQLQTWQQILQVAPVGYLMVDEDNQLLWCNEQARQLLNIDRWEPGQVRLLLELVRSYDLDQLIEQTRLQQQSCQQDWVFHPTFPDAEAMGKSASITLRAYSWPLSAGKVCVFLENRQGFVELSQARDRWMSDLAHELRTPLTSIQLVVENLQKRLEPPLSRWVERLLPEVNRLINLVQDWLELSQLEVDPSKKLNRQPLELHSLIQSVWQTLEPLARAKQLSLDYSGAQELWIVADESRLYRVFLNILDNSIKYSPIEGIIIVEVNLLLREDAANQVQINVIDSGMGFLEADLPYVFERLYRGDRSRTRQTTSVSRGENLPPEEAGISSTTGSGLGLAIVRQIILAHGGTITASNHPQTRGAWLKIELPYG